MALSEPQKKYLRGIGHNLKPLVTVGDAGVTDGLKAEFDTTLSHHELIKIKVRVGDRKTRDQIIAGLCADHRATLVQRIGNVALMYRANPEKKPDKRLRIPNR